jgi:hypothetical protein
MHNVCEDDSSEKMTMPIMRLVMLRLTKTKV